MARLPVGALLLAALACTACASHGLDLNFGEFDTWSSSAKSFFMPEHGLSTHESEPAYVICKYYVPPSLAAEFVSKWTDYIGQPTSKARGIVMVTLERPVITNGIYIAYAEFETMKDFKNHFFSKDEQDFLQWVNQHDIKWEQEFLKNSSGQKVQRWSGGKSEGWAVLSTVIVKPHVAESFKDAWNSAADKVVEENGNVVYSLRRIATVNDRYYVYGSWVSENAWKDHLEADHIRRLSEFAQKNDVVYFESPLKGLFKYIA